MSSARRTGLLAACIVGLVGALISQPDSTAEAQAPAAVGSISKNYRMGITSWPDAKVMVSHINLLPTTALSTAVATAVTTATTASSRWEGRTGPCLGWKGVTQVPNPELRFKMTDAKAGQGHEEHGTPGRRGCLLRAAVMTRPQFAFAPTGRRRPRGWPCSRRPQAVGSSRERSSWRPDGMPRLVTPACGAAWSLMGTLASSTARPRMDPRRSPCWFCRMAAFGAGSGVE
jgi:hypothetical protein